MNKILPLLMVTTWLTACAESDSINDLKPDEVVITYLANTDEQGSCEPTYQAMTLKDSDGLSANKLYMIEGETEYFLADNRKIGEIPFQIKVNEKATTSGLNEVVACTDLNIKVTVEKCKYEWGTERDGCPAIIIKGQESFGGIKFVIE